MRGRGTIKSDAVAMDISTHSSASSQSQPQQPGGGSSSATAPLSTMSPQAEPQPHTSSSAASTTSNGNDSVSAPAGQAANALRKPQAPQPSREQMQLLKLRDANAKYKNLLKLAKERIQEHEGLLEERQCMYNII